MEDDSKNEIYNINILLANYETTLDADDNPSTHMSTSTHIYWNWNWKVKRDEFINISNAWNLQVTNLGLSREQWIQTTANFAIK